MDIIGKEIRFTRRLKFGQKFDDGFVFVEFYDETGNEKRKRAIENLTDEMLGVMEQVILAEEGES